MLAEYQFTLSHRAGAKHGNADGLSRQCSECKQCDNIERRDGGPTWKDMQITDELEINHGQVLEGSTRPGTCSVLEGRDREAETVVAAACSISTSSELHKEIVPLQQRVGSNTAIVRQLLVNQAQPSQDVLEQGSSELKKLCSLIPVMKIEDEILKVRVNVNNRHVWSIVCPTELRPLVIQQHHSQHHAGVNSTYKKIRLSWYWPGMVSQIRRTVKKCEICQAAKHSNTKPPGYRQRLYSGRPWQVLSLDLVGPFTKTPRENTMVLVLADHFTRWRDAIALKDGTTKSIAEALEQRVFCLFWEYQRESTQTKVLPLSHN